jgi:hypothetical protein
VGDSPEDSSRAEAIGLISAARSLAGEEETADLKQDVRMMVPLFKDVEQEEYHVLAVVGYEQRNEGELRRSPGGDGEGWQGPLRRTQALLG